LRDYLAGQALAGLCARMSDERFNLIFEGIHSGVKEAKVALILADAMIAQRAHDLSLTK
jgi:hypothetical protein